MSDSLYPVGIDDLYPGTAFYWKRTNFDRPHLYIILTEPDIVESKLVVVSVNLTGKTERGLGSDTTVILDIGDHPFITKPSVIVYKKASFFNVEKLIQYINDERCLEEEDLKDDLLKKIQQGLLDSDQTLIEIYKYCQQKFEL